MLEFTDEEISRIKQLYLIGTFTFIEIADKINAEFHKSKPVRNEDSIYRAMDDIALDDSF